MSEDDHSNQQHAGFTDEEIQQWRDHGEHIFIESDPDFLEQIIFATSNPDFLERLAGATEREKILELVDDTLYDCAGANVETRYRWDSSAQRQTYDRMEYMKRFCDPVRGYEHAQQKRSLDVEPGVIGLEPVRGLHKCLPQKHFFYNSRMAEDYTSDMRQETSGVFGRHSIPYEERQPAQLAEHLKHLSECLLKALNVLVVIGYWASDPADHGGLVHFTAGGTKYHVALDCSALTNGQRVASSSQPIETALLSSLRRGKGEKTACKTCCPPAEDD